MIKNFNECYTDFLMKHNNDYDIMYFNDTVVTKNQMLNQIDNIAKHLFALGIKKGMGVGYSLKNDINIIPLFLAIAKTGAYAIPVFSNMPPIPKMNFFKKAEASIIITNEAALPSLEQIAKKGNWDISFAVVESDTKNNYSITKKCTTIETIPNYPAEGNIDHLPLLIGSSSGTTGIPKMVSMTQKNIGSEMIVSTEMVNLEIGDEKHCIINVAFPLSTSVMLVICGYMFTGSTLVFSDDISQMTFLKNIEKWKCTEMSCPPAYYESLLLLKDKHPYDLSSIHGMSAGMDFCPPALLKRLKTLFPNLHFYTNGYGLVETCNVYMYTKISIENEEITKGATLTLASNADNIIEVRDENGKVIKDGEVGEIYVHGPNVVDGYMKTPTEVIENFTDNWLKTGDIARKESDRSVTLLGRKKYFIKRGGKSISPIVVQTEINKVPGIIDSGVVGVPHPLYGEMIWAFVVKEKDKNVTLKDIKKNCRKNLPFYMLPDQITFVDIVAKKSGVGKVDFETLRNMAKEELKKLGHLDETMPNINNI